MEKFQDYLLGSQFQVYMVNNPHAYIQDSKLGVSQIWRLSELVLLNFTIKYQTGCSKDTDALSHHLYNPSCDIKSETNKDEVEVISYSPVCEAVY